MKGVNILLNMFYALLLAFLYPYVTNGLYFHIGEQEKKCFVEEIPDETLIVGKYKVEIFDQNTNSFVATPEGLGMHVEVRDAEEKVIMSRTYASEGRFTFTSHSAGEHTICLHSNSTAWYSSGKLRVHLDIQTGDHAVDYQQMQAKDKLSDLQVRIRQLLTQVEQISREQNYQRFREERFRRISESTNQRALWWSVAQVVVLLVTGLWQMRHLRGFFEAKKLV